MPISDSLEDPVEYPVGWKLPRTYQTEKRGRAATPSTEWRKVVGKRIQAVRKANGWSQADFAQKLDVRRAKVGHWETGRSAPTLNDIQILKDRLGMCDEDFAVTMSPHARLMRPNFAADIETRADHRKDVIQYLYALSPGEIEVLWSVISELMFQEQIDAWRRAILNGLGQAAMRQPDHE